KGSSTGSTWFSGFTEILKGWFQKESSENDKIEAFSRAAEQEKEAVKTPRVWLQKNSSNQPAGIFSKTLPCLRQLKI
ncbi:MAG: hypothetical protein ACOYXC_07125, partial [Candidatus Rifleibacteriota bacterium]